MRSKSNRLLRRISVSYALLFLVPVVIGLTALLLTVELKKNHVLDSSQKTLIAASDLVEAEFTAIDAAASSLYFNTDVQDILTMPQNNNQYFIKQTASKMPYLHTGSGILKRYFVYYHDAQQEFLLGNNISFQKKDYYYPSCFRFGDLSAEEFWKLIKDVRNKTIFPSAHTVYMNVPEESILIVYPYRNSFFQTVAHCLMYIDTNKLTELLQSATVRSNVKWIGVYHADGQLLSGSSNALMPDLLPTPEQMVGREGYLRLHGLYEGNILQYVRTGSGRIYTILTPDLLSSTTEGSSFLYTCLLIVVPVLLALFFIWFLQHKSKKPMKEMAELLTSEEACAGPGLWPVKYSVERLLSEKKSMDTQLACRNMQLRDSVTMQLLRGSFSNKEELLSLLHHVGVELAPGAEYRILCASSCPMPEELLPAFQYLITLNGHEHILLYTQQEEKPPVEEAVAALYKLLAQESEVTLRVGTPCASVRTIHQSYESIRWLLQGEGDSQAPVRYAETLSLGNTYDYAVQDETRLLSAIQRNDTDKIDEILNQLFFRNFIKRKPSFLIQQSLYYALIHSISRTECTLPMPEEFCMVPLSMDPEAFYGMLRSQCYTIAAWLQSTRQHRQSLMLDRVITFVTENYANPDMGLTLVAQEFGVTEKHLSETFRSQADIGFSVYLEQLRMVKARELLTTTSLTVEAISEAVGYANVRSFRRVYARVFGHPPTEDRSSNIDPNAEA